MRKIAATIAAVALVIALAFLYIKAKEFSGTDHERFLEALWRLKQLDTVFNEDVLKARFALLDNYDDFQAYEEELVRLVETLSEPPASIDPAGLTAIEAARTRFAVVSEQRQILFERFKSKNAMLANSSRYLPVALGELAARFKESPDDRELDIIVSDVTRLVLMRLSSPDELAPDAPERLQRLRDWCASHRDHAEAGFVSSLTRHVQNIVTGNGDVDALTRQILAVPTAETIERLVRAYEAEVTKALQRAQQYRVFLYVVCLVLMAGIGYTLWALRAANSRLEQRVEERTRDLASSEERFRTLSGSAPIGIFLTDAGGRALYTNPYWQRITGVSLEMSLGEGWVKAVHPEDAVRVFAEWQSAAGAGREFRGQFRFCTTAGEVLWVHVQSAAIRSETGEVTSHVGTVENITERKRAEEELAKTQRELLETSRLAGMAEVATGVLHNVGNVLNSVNVSTTLVAERARKSKVANLAKVVALMEEHAADLGAFITTDPKGKQLPDYLAKLADHLAAEQVTLLKEMDELRKNIEHIKDIVAMQQTYARVSGVTETLSISDLVDDALRMNTGALTRHEVQVVREYAEVPPVTVEKHKVLQVLVNLIRNAKYACDESGRTDKRLTVRVANGEGRIRIAISDNGIGIPAENLVRIFNHGFTTKKDGHGFGLHSGALAAREIGGSLGVHSDGPGRGATFTLELPLQP